MDAAARGYKWFSSNPGQLLVCHKQKQHGSKPRARRKIPQLDTSSSLTYRHRRPDEEMATMM